MGDDIKTKNAAKDSSSDDTESDDDDKKEKEQKKEKKKVETNMVEKKEFSPGKKKKAKVIRTGGNGRFQRIKVRSHFEKDGLDDNRYDGYDEYASKAHNKLIKTRGKGFTKEKNKKKRATFHGGGAISMGVNSIKFDD